MENSIIDTIWPAPVASAALCQTGIALLAFTRAKTIGVALTVISSYALVNQAITFYKFLQEDPYSTSNYFRYHFYQSNAICKIKHLINFAFIPYRYLDHFYSDYPGL